MGIEMFLGNFNDGGPIAIGSRRYYFKQSNFTSDDVLKHLEGDYWKLNRITPNNYLLLYFITHVFTRNTPGRRRERVERIFRITNALRGYKEIDQKRLVIIEVLYENGIRTSRKKLGLPVLD